MSDQAERAKRPEGRVSSGPRYRRILAPLVFTSVLLALIAASLEGFGVYLVIALFCSVIVLAAVIHLAFPGSRFFGFAFANLIGIYACVFGLFLEAHFQQVNRIVVTIGFVAPLAAFLVGVLWRRHMIRTIVSATTLREERNFARVYLWLAPVFFVGGLTFLIPEQGVSPATLDWIFLAAMLVISAVVMVASRDVAIFLLDTALLFEEFYERAKRLIVPGFAFLTSYSLMVILFGSIYSALDRLTAIPHFRIGSELRPIRFGESLYFSVTTLSTVGYGDIAPATGLARILVGFEILCGVLLLIFGVNEVLNYARGGRSDGRR
jgi:voltage-gated potassium channel